MKIRSIASFLKLVGGGGGRSIDKMVLPSYHLIIERFHFKITKKLLSTD